MAKRFSSQGPMQAEDLAMGEALSRPKGKDF
jgi:hypothetical protein